MSALTWIAHDRAEHDRVNAILAALRQPEARDEMGIGALRDTLADTLFPGTTTIQTRLRYMLFVPWCYQLAQSQTNSPAAFAKGVERLERDLIAPLKLGDDAEGIFGAVAGEHIKRLPSSVYWSGLHRWGIRRQSWSIGQTAQNLRKLKLKARRVHRTDEGEAYADLGMWHADLPPRPAEFPKGMTFALNADEAAFLKGRIIAIAPDSLLAWLTMQEPSLALSSSAIASPWDLPNLPPHLREIVEIARILSWLVRGAAFLYNYLLALEPHPDPDAVALIRDHRAADLATFHGQQPDMSLTSWDLVRLKKLTDDAGHHVTATTWTFIENWRDFVATGEDPRTSAHAMRLVRERELAVKKRARSRFLNHDMRAAWSGYAGAGRIVYRWSTVQRLLRDLQTGLQAEH